MPGGVRTPEEVLAELDADAAASREHAQRVLRWADGVVDTQGLGAAVQGQIQIAVDAQGRLAGVSIEPGMRGRSAQALSAALTEAARAATTDLEVRLLASTDETFGAESQTSLAMRADLQRILHRGESV